MNNETFNAYSRVIDNVLSGHIEDYEMLVEKYKGKKQKSYIIIITLK